MIKKSFIHIFIFILISQCGFSPMYSQNSNFNENIFINSMEFKGDEEINKYLKIYLSKYTIRKKMKTDLIYRQIQIIINKLFLKTKLQK